jgi:hypothetical protein
MSITINTKPATSPEAVTLPTWTDSASVTSYLTSAVATVVAIITLLHPGFHEPSNVQSLIPLVSFVIASGAQAINIITHRSAQKAAIVASPALLGVVLEHGVPVAGVNAPAVQYPA